MASERSGVTQEEQHLSALTEEEHRELVRSALRIKKSVVKLVHKETVENQCESIGTAFLVHRSGDLSLFFTCEHTFGNLDPKDFVVRFTEEEEVAAMECTLKVIARDSDDDLLLFSIKGGPAGLDPLRFSMEPIKRCDRVAAIGYSYMIIPDVCRSMLIINEPSIMTGRMLCDSFEMEEKKTRRTFRGAKAISDTRYTAGNSGSPVIRNGEVIAVHCQSDATWRESVPASRVLKFLKRHLKKRAANVTIEKLLQEISDRETAPLISKLKREDGRKEAPQTSQPSREDDWEKVPQTSNPESWLTYRRRKRKPEQGSADDDAKET